MRSIIRVLLYNADYCIYYLLKRHAAAVHLYGTLHLRVVGGSRDAAWLVCEGSSGNEHDTGGGESNLFQRTHWPTVVSGIAALDIVQHLLIRNAAA